MLDISALYYAPIIIWTVFVVAFAYYIMHASKDGNQYLLTRQSVVPITIFAIVMILFIGFRPSNGLAFCDMFSYELNYKRAHVTNVSFSLDKEWFWQWIIVACKKMGLSSTNWFALIEFVYIGGAFWFCKKLLHENVALAMMFFFSSFSFFSYGTNTIRQGFAAGMLLVGFAYLTDKRNWWIGVVVFLFAFGVHRSMIIPIICMCISKWVLKSVKIATWIWGGSVIVSLVLGGYFAQYFADMNFDDRVAGYAGGEAGVYKTGFRFDFLIYSAMPIIASWYACVKKNIKDDVFNMLSVSYILANALWVQCIRIPYTDRFAYTSWFLYPFVLAYAFIRLRLSDNQDRLVGKILLIQACFTLFMYLKSS